MKHAGTHHNEIPPTYTCKVIKTYKTSLLRQIGEALAINNTDASFLMNSKAEFEMNRIPRVVIEDSTQGEDASPAAKSQTVLNSISNSVDSRSLQQDGAQRRKRARTEASSDVLQTRGIQAYLNPIRSNLSLGLESVRNEIVCRDPAQ